MAPSITPSPLARLLLSFRAPRPVLFLAALAAFAAVEGRAAIDEKGKEPRPNIVVILADDLGWADVGFQGSDLHRTPAIDGLARDGRVFTDAYASAPVCSPSRAALLTGKTPARLWLTVAITQALAGKEPGPGKEPDFGGPLINPVTRNHLPLEEITIAERLAEAGYHTGFIGKWHLQLEDEERFGPAQQGFAHVVEMGNGAWANYYPPYEGGLHHQRAGTYLTDKITEEAVAFIENPVNRPFFLLVSHFAVHTPIVAKSREMVDPYRQSSQEARHHTNPVYAAMVESLDQSVAAIRRAVVDAGLAENTLIIFTSDNGGELQTRSHPFEKVTDNHPLDGGKGSLSEGGIRVPFVAVWPGVIPAGTQSSVPIAGYDLFPTLMEIAGISSASEELDGLSLFEEFQGRAAPLSRALYFHLPHWRSQSSAIRHDNWKLIKFYESGASHLYDLRQDPGEAEDLSAVHPETASALRAELLRYLQSVNAQFPVAL